MPDLHPSPADLRAFVQGKLPAAEAAAVEAHLAECDACTEHLVAAPDDTLLQLAREAATESLAAPLPRATPLPRTPAELVDHPRYKLRGLLGSGGMGAVYKAEHRLMERFVALKVIRPELTASPQAVERFRREVKAAARLSHPNIVAALDAEQAGEVHFLVMEYVEGISLDRLLAQQGTLAPAQACALVRQAALGLAHAHEKGMIHRDIKPQNLMVTRGGQVKILDLGLARLAAPSQLDFDVAEPGAAAPADAARTSAGMFLGTPDYIAPEQARDPRSADARSDIYSLGCTLYYLLTGQPPFPGGTAEEKLAAHDAKRPPLVTSLRAGIPPEVASLVERMLAKNPAERPGTASEVAKALQPLARSAAVAAAPSPAANPGVSPPLAPAAAPIVIVPAPPPAALSPLPQASATTAPPKAGAERALWPWAVGGGVALVALVVLVNLGGLGLGLGGHSDKSGEGTGQGGETPRPGAASVLPPAARTGRVLFVIPSVHVWYRDYGPVKARLEAGGLQVTTAAIARGPSRPSDDPNLPNPPPVNADVSIYDRLPAREYDALLFAGYGVHPYVQPGDTRDTIARLLADFQAEGKVIGAICCGQAVLAGHGLLDGREAAGGKLVREAFPAAAAARQVQWTDRPLVLADAGRLITARDDQSGREFAEAVLASVGR